MSSTSKTLESFHIFKHDELNINVQQELGVEDCDKVVRNEEGVFTPLNIRVGVELDVVEELNRELSEGVKESTHFLTIVLNKSTDILHDHIYSSSNARTAFKTS
ncbi:hypothetical protein J1N35_033695 [Gossypium stocksii]|uniref:Uncharacterized protein n=1 Tax=Gossypium stocksii TaxID=47602 RepID=A0A9D3ZPU8_9ROSI|nr:hypothetical protein J1N35_033695 [Gossypium stocksii]